MEWHYPARYSDKNGVELTSLRNDGTNLVVELRGVLFSGPDFDGLAPDPQSTAGSLKSFALHNGDSVSAQSNARSRYRFRLSGRKLQAFWLYN